MEAQMAHYGDYRNSPWGVTKLSVYVPGKRRVKNPCHLRYSLTKVIEIWDKQLRVFPCKQPQGETTSSEVEIRLVYS